MRVYSRRTACVLGLLTLAGSVAAAPTRPVRVGVLQSGTAQWELNVIAQHGLAAANGIEIAVTALIGKDAPAVALQAGSVDVILTDFIWVSRERRAGADFTFVPHSTATGAIMVRPDSHILTPADLVGKKIGVAGNAVDKSWLLFRAYCERLLGGDPAHTMRAVFAAPPLLDALLTRGEFPAVLNFWNYTARLKARGDTQLLSVRQMLAALDMPETVPLLGWVFSEKWAAARPAAIAGFLRASRAAEQVLATSDAEWERLRGLTQAENTATLIALRDGYRAGIVTRYDPKADAAAAATLFQVLAKVGGPAVAGDSAELAPGTFWPGTHF